jgi:hypothetical protein
LAAIGGGRQVGLTERHARTVEINLAAYATQAGAQRPIDFDGIGPRGSIVIAHVTPPCIVVKRTSNAARFWRFGIIMPAQPGEAIAPAHALLDQGKAHGLPCLETRLGAGDFVAADANPLLNDGMSR